MGLKTNSQTSQIPEPESSSLNNAHVFAGGCCRIWPAQKKLLLRGIIDVANLLTAIKLALNIQKNLSHSSKCRMLD